MPSLVRAYPDTEDWLRAVSWDLPMEWEPFVAVVENGVGLLPFLKLQSMKAAPPAIVDGYKAWLPTQGLPVRMVPPWAGKNWPRIEQRRADNAARMTAARARRAEFDESKIVRAEHGRFGEKDTSEREETKPDASMPTTKFGTVVTMDGLPEKVQDKVMANVRDKLGIDPPELAGERFTQLLENARGTDAWDAGMTWYQDVHDRAEELSAQSGVPASDIAGGLAAMSAGTKWDSELPIIETMVTLTDGEVNISAGRLEALNATLAKEGLDPVANGARYGDLDNRSATLAMQKQHQDEYEGTSAGWGVQYSYSQYERALDTVRNDEPDRLNGVKVREFYNNIAEPQNGDGHVTIDVMMMRAAAANPDVQNDSSITSSPAYQGTGLGPTPYLADEVRAIADREGILPQQAQAIIWTQWELENPPRR